MIRSGSKHGSMVEAARSQATAAVASPASGASAEQTLAAERLVARHLRLRLVGLALPSLVALTGVVASPGCRVLLDIDHVETESGAGESDAGELEADAPALVDASPYTREYVTTEDGSGHFPLSVEGQTVPLVASSGDYPGVLRVLGHLQADMGRVIGVEPELLQDEVGSSRQIVLAGTLGHSALVDRLVQEDKLDVADVQGRWETFVLQVVDSPLPDVDRALVIAGSDKRGTIYGVYDLSAQMGVSPWYYWADIPVVRRGQLYVVPGRYTRGEPAVRYRGIFINDEDPALNRWVNRIFGSYNDSFYEKVFELMLRLKANYLWPAMWGKAFNADDSDNQPLADEFGIVMGTSHHEPMMRAEVEWDGEGHSSEEWDYTVNEAALREFWAEGIRRMGSYESIVTVGMRGKGDTPMTAEADIELLEGIVADQRSILAEVTGRQPSSIPQVWTLYKEVQDYYDMGMEVPDDVTLLLADDRWGNLRKVPKPDAEARSGGFGVYYHYDFVGAPRSYKWINTNPISRVWEQMHLAYRHGVDRVWIVNVGDIKPMEFPTEFFLDYAWDPESWSAESLADYAQGWAERQFGPGYAEDIGEILINYGQYNGRRKPELVAPDTYSLVDYREAERIVAEYNSLADDAEWINRRLAEEYADAYYQLVLYPVKACANLNELYVSVGRNRLYAKQGRAATNDLAARAQELFDVDQELAEYYHEEIADGKWLHMMDQSNIGYTGWQAPEEDVMPEVEEIDLPEAAEMGVAIEGSDSWWPNEASQAVLPEFSPYQQLPDYYIEVFNRGATPFEYRVESGAAWPVVSPSEGEVETEERLAVSVDWEDAPAGSDEIPITINGPNGTSVVVQALIHNPSSPDPNQVEGFVEANGYVSMEAEHFSQAVDTEAVSWQAIPDFGRTLSGMTPFPVTAGSQSPEGNSPRLEYAMHLFSSGVVTVRVYVSPTQNIYGTEGLRYAVSFDEQEPQIVNIHSRVSQQAWSQQVADCINVTTSTHTVNEPGEHVLKYWMVDPGVVVQKLVVETGDLKRSYLGPPESLRGGS
jgi:hypothetical protein